MTWFHPMTWLRAAFFPFRAIAWTKINTWVRHSFPEVPTISTKQLAHNLTQQPKALLLLDTRSAEEYHVSHLPGAIHSPTLEDAEAAILSYDSNNTASQNHPEVVLYCSIGYRSGRLGKALQAKGYTVVNLEGSIFQWSNEKRPITSAGQPTHAVHPYSLLWSLLLNS